MHHTIACCLALENTFIIRCPFCSLAHFSLRFHPEVLNICTSMGMKWHWAIRCYCLQTMWGFQVRIQAENMRNGPIKMLYGQHPVRHTHVLFLPLACLLSLSFHYDALCTFPTLTNLWPWFLDNMIYLYSIGKNLNSDMWVKSRYLLKQFLFLRGRFPWHC